MDMKLVYDSESMAIPFERLLDQSIENKTGETKGPSVHSLRTNALMLHLRSGQSIYIHCDIFPVFLEYTVNPWRAAMRSRHPKFQIGTTVLVFWAQAPEGRLTPPRSPAASWARARTDQLERPNWRAMDFGPRSWVPLDGAWLDLSARIPSSIPSACYQTINPRPSRIPPTRRASRFLLDICCCVSWSRCSYYSPASNDTIPASEGARKVERSEHRNSLESIHRNPLSN